MKENTSDYLTKYLYDPDIQKNFLFNMETERTVRESENQCVIPIYCIYTHRQGAGVTLTLLFVLCHNDIFLNL